jgi:hypothetical protein
MLCRFQTLIIVLTLIHIVILLLIQTGITPHIEQNELQAVVGGTATTATAYTLSPSTSTPTNISLNTNSYTINSNQYDKHTYNSTNDTINDMTLLMAKFYGYINPIDTGANAYSIYYDNNTKTSYLCKTSDIDNALNNTSITTIPSHKFIFSSSKSTQQNSIGVIYDNLTDTYKLTGSNNYNQPAFPITLHGYDANDEALNNIIKDRYGVSSVNENDYYIYIDHNDDQATQGSAIIYSKTELNNYISTPSSTLTFCKIYSDDDSQETISVMRTTNYTATGDSQTLANSVSADLTGYKVNGISAPFYNASNTKLNEEIKTKFNDTDVQPNEYCSYIDPTNKTYVYKSSDLADIVTGTAGLNINYMISTSTSGSQYKVGNNVVYKYDSADASQKEALRQVLSDWADEFPGANIADNTTLEDIYTYEEMGVRYFVKKGDLDDCIANQNDQRFLQENQVRLATYRAESINTKIEETEKARVQVNGEGRWENIQYENSSAIYTLTTETKTDEEAYNAAMNQYTHDMAKYEKTLQDINAKTEVIEAEDRTLELRLKQLDTEQKALQTEMEAVAKVIQKNVETTFKTFNG